MEREGRRYRETLLVIVLGFALLSFTRIGHEWMLYGALGLGVLGMLSMDLNRWIHQGWFFIGEKLGFVVSKVVLGALFMAILLPMALLSGIFRKDVMRLRSARGSYHRRDHLYEAKDLENMW